MKRRILCVVLSTMLVALSACSASNESASIDNNAAVEEEKSEEVQPEEEKSAEAEAEVETADETIEADDAESAETEAEEDATDEPEEETVITSEELANMDSVEFAALLKMGWNLGNTLDANAVGGLESETCWNQPKTTQELISYVKEVGFTSIRVPVSWGKHTDDNYQIDEEWMGRVKEVVDYAYNANLYVIINSHHDNDYYYPSEENYANAEKYLSAIWTQIAEEFKEYDNHLIFESMNEPRLSGTNIEWWFALGDPEGRAATERISKLNQVFVDTVRATGGNNENRFLMVPSYAANPDYATFNAFTMPTDTAQNKLMLSVHAYTPYDFAGNPNGYSDWDGSKTYEFNFMGKLKAMFINEGYGVVIGEFGATNKGNDESRAKWARGYCMKAASFGIPYFVWDNGGIGVGEENFGVIDRKNLKLSFPEVFEAYATGYPN